MKEFFRKKSVNIVLLTIIFIIGILLIIFLHLENKYYVVYKNIDDNTYQVKYVEMTKRELIRIYSKYDIVIVNKVLNEKEYDYEHFKNTNIKNSNYGVKFNDNVILSYKEMIDNNIITINNYDVNIENLNNYLYKKGINEKIDKIDNVTIILFNSYLIKNKKLVNLIDGPYFEIINKNN